MATRSIELPVRLKDSILVLTQKSQMLSYVSNSMPIGCQQYVNMPYIHAHAIWIYNLWTERWRKYSIQNQEELPEVKLGQSGVVIGTDVYIFGGHDLWKLTANAPFVFSMIHVEDKTKVPSPRFQHCAWEHGEKMWVFGGFGQSAEGYLNDHGDFIDVIWQGAFGNNQLLSYDPSTNTWTDVKCSGEVPSPQMRCSAAKMQDTVWLYGRIVSFSHDLYKLNMCSFAWTKIETTMPRPIYNQDDSLISISASQLLLCGGLPRKDFKTSWSPPG